MNKYSSLFQIHPGSPCCIKLSQNGLYISSSVIITLWIVPWIVDVQLAASLCCSVNACSQCPCCPLQNLYSSGYMGFYCQKPKKV